MKISNLNELFIHELNDLYSAEKQLTKALPKMSKAAFSDELREAVESHLEETRNQVSRLEEIFEKIGEKPKRMTCKAMQGLIEEGEEILKESQQDTPVRDAAIIMAAQRVEHYEIAGYGTACSHASHLGIEEVEDLLNQTLEEEKNADDKLNELAEDFINEKSQESGESEVDEGSEEEIEEDEEEVSGRTA